MSRQLDRPGLVRAAAGAVLVAAAVLVASGARGQSADPATPVEQLTVEQLPVEQLILQLGDPDYHVREAAETALAEMGYAAYDALTEAERHADLEIGARARYLLRLITVEWHRPDDPEAVRRLFEGYDELSLEERRGRVEQLSTLPSDQGLSGLCRIVRFDRSELLAKQTALLICERRPATGSRVERIRRELSQGTRSAARWLEAYCQEATDLRQAARLWGEVALAEFHAGQRRPDSAPPALQAWLERRQATALRRAGDLEQARGVISRMIEQEQGDVESLERLVDWLVTEEAWPSIDEVAARFEQLFQTEVMLIYSLAQARLVQGRSDEAEQLANQAAALQPEQLTLHAEIGDRLRRRGQTRWAEKEYRRVIEHAPVGSVLSLAAQRMLAEMLHDTLDFGPAADVLDASVAAMRENVKQGREVENTGPIEEVLARALYLRGQQRLEQSDLAGGRELLEQALEQNPLDVDVLIALSNIKDLSPATRARVGQRVEQAAQMFRTEVSQSPGDGTPYNQLAWLLSNTGGDLDEALDASRRSLELQPEEPAFLDTLGRVSYARGDLEDAVEHQTRAVELSPHSGLMRRQLELFRTALERRRATADQGPTTE